MSKWASLFVFGLCGMAAQTAIAQVVQLPSVGFFDLSTTVEVPDAGSAMLGSSMGGRGSVSRTGSGSRRGVGVGTAHATLIDLTELDSMIRSQAGKVPDQPRLQPTSPREQVHIRSAAKGRVRDLEYDYLVALSQYGQVVESQDRDAVAYYLGMAEQARNRGNWSSVELYYRLAWKNLPAGRRRAALAELARARAGGHAEENDSKSPARSK